MLFTRSPQESQVSVTHTVRQTMTLTLSLSLPLTHSDMFLAEGHMELGNALRAIQ